jgi:hypothetical protein
MLLLYSHTITPRLQYITGFISSELFDAPIVITDDRQRFAGHEGPRLNYSGNAGQGQEFFIQAGALLFEEDIRPQPVSCFEINGYKAFFGTEGDFPFDILAAAFYLVSRYEEYLPHKKDSYGRYAHGNSLAFREGFLQLPLVNIWLLHFKNALQHKFPSIAFKHHRFKFIPTYDIDIAYSYRQKGIVRNAGGFMRSFIRRRWEEINDRWLVLLGKRKDPFDAYEWMDALHLYCKVKPVYFFLVAREQKAYDKNIPTSSKALQQLIEYCAKVYAVGLHPSWQSSIAAGTGILKEEKEWLEAMADRNILLSRQHYIKFELPLTYRRLLECGIKGDYSMGYGSINGFRASVASSFKWFDLERNEATALELFPFCFMDANAFYEQQVSPQQAYDELVHYYNIVKKYSGVLIAIWHNSFLGSATAFSGWREIYELFMKEHVYWDAYNY